MLRLIPLAAIVAFLLPSCSVLNFATNAEMTVAMDADSVAISLDEWDWDDGFYWDLEGYDDTEVSLSNTEEYHIVRVSKEGYFPETMPLFPTERNPLKLVDAGMTGLGVAMMGRGLSSVEDNAGVWAGVGFGLAFYNGLGLLAPPKRVYQKHYDLPALRPMPTCDNDTTNLLVEGFHMRIDSANHAWAYYETMRDFERGNDEYHRSSDEAIELEYSNLDEDMMEILVQQGYQEDEEGTLFDQGDAVKIAGALTHVKEHRVAGVVRYDVKSSWWMYNPYDMPTDTLNLAATSVWGPYDPTDGLDRDLVSDALVHSMFEAIESPVILDSWTSETEWAGQWKADWATVEVPRVEASAGKVARALPSVVTIDASDGHGSGCIISEDGWIVTNHHVIADTSLTYEVYFEDGSKREATIERWEPLYDLALLKVDTTGLVPFAIDLSEGIPVGDEVYAIGTPFDVELGATLTKGIISGRRKDGNRTLIQSDVSISPGNSGGALVDAQGTLIGIVNQKIFGMGVEGIGFAIPAHYLEDALGLKWSEVK
jgi:hypothetical protein